MVNYLRNRENATEQAQNGRKWSINRQNIEEGFYGGKLALCDKHILFCPRLDPS